MRGRIVHLHMTRTCWSCQWEAIGRLPFSGQFQIAKCPIGLTSTEESNGSNNAYNLVHSAHTHKQLFPRVLLFHSEELRKAQTIVGLQRIVFLLVIPLSFLLSHCVAKRQVVSEREKGEDNYVLPGL